MPRARISVENKHHLFEAWQRGEDYLDRARQLNINRHTAYGIVRRASQRNGRVVLPRGGRRHGIINEDLGNLLAEIVEDHPTYTLGQIRREALIRNPMLPPMSNTTVARCLNQRLIVIKKMEDAPGQRNTEATKERRREYALWILDDVARELVFIDECGINLWLRRTRGRALRGQRAVRVVDGRRGQNFTVVFAVSNLRGLLLHDIFAGGMSGERFVGFLRRLFPIAENGRHYPVTYIFDNAACHRMAHRPVDEGGPVVPIHHSIRALPPYSPFLNMVELAISAFKAMLKRHLEEIRPQLIDGNNHEERMAILVQLAEQSVAAITQANAVS